MPSANAVPNQTALHGAAEHGFDKFIEFLVANGADLTAKDANGRTPLDVARGAGGNRGGADAFPKTVALLESLMKSQGDSSCGGFEPVDTVKRSTRPSRIMGAFNSARAGGNVSSILLISAALMPQAALGDSPG